MKTHNTKPKTYNSKPITRNVGQGSQNLEQTSPEVTSYKLQVTRRKGFTVLFSVVFSALLLMIGVSIFNIALKELNLSSSGRESQFAFYAADTAMECALYYDKHGAFREYGEISTEYTGDINCDSYNMKADPAIGYDLFPMQESSEPVTKIYYISGVPHNTQTVETKLSFQMKDLPYCAQIFVYKAATSTPLGYTEIEARGYNTCDLSDPRRVERGIVAKYFTVPVQE